MNARMITGIVVLSLLACEARADFILWNDEQLTVNTHHNLGTLYNWSQVHVISGGSVGGLLSACDFSTVDMSGGWINYLHANDISTVDITGGTVASTLGAGGRSTVNVSGGSVGYLWAQSGSTVDLSGGSVTYLLQASGFSTVNISGGSVIDLWADGYSLVTFDAREFNFGDGLSLECNRVLGAGILSGEWFDGTQWAVNILDSGDYGAYILVVPEPATLSLLALGGLALLRGRRQKVAQN